LEEGAEGGEVGHAHGSALFIGELRGQPEAAGLISNAELGVGAARVPGHEHPVAQL